MSERDKFLDGRIGDWNNGNIMDFSTWEAFGRLWEWAQQHEWWGELTVSYLDSWDIKDEGILSVNPHYINPDRFADAVYEFLKGRNP